MSLYTWFVLGGHSQAKSVLPGFFCYPEIFTENPKLNIMEEEKSETTTVPRSESELRRMFLEFFESKGHLVMKSFSLVPHNDNSLLLINSGMAPLKPYFTGQGDPTKKKSDHLPEMYPYR